MIRCLTLFFIAMNIFVVAHTHAELRKPQDPLWEQIEDTVYLQEFAQHVPTEQGITAVAVHDGQVFVGDNRGVSELKDNALQTCDTTMNSVHRLKSLNGDLWAVTNTGLWKRSNEKWSRISQQPVRDICEHEGSVIAAAGNGLFRVEGDSLTAISQVGRGRIQGIASYGGTIYVHDGRQVGLLQNEHIIYGGIFEWGTLEKGAAIRDMMAYGSRLYVATDEGISLLRGMTWYQIKGEQGLPYEDTTCLARGFDRDLWIGTMRGAIRNIKDEYQFFGHQRWIPHDQVNAIATADNVTYIATEGGLGIIRYEPYTLAKKAAYYERWIEEWGMKRLGFIHGLFLIDGIWQREVSDNDVGYSSHYMAAKCFEYAVTGSPEARAQALNMMKSVKWSEEITPMDGFPARSIYNVGELTLKANHGSGGLPAEWHATDDGNWEWKGDTSSDETDAHVYETTLFLELVANAEEKVWATDHLHRVMGHIVDNGFFLRDFDGKPTRWARWDPEYLQTPYGYYARGLNGMEAFNYMTTAYHFTGDEKFMKGKQQLIGWNYSRDIIRQKLAANPSQFTHFDDRLAFYSYYPLIQYETDPKLKASWLRSLERAWEIKRIEAVPWFNFIYGALTGNDCETDRAVAHLREWPMDLRRLSYTNSHRHDLHTPEGYRAYADRTKPLSPRETEPNRWDGDFMQLDGGSGGRSVADVGGWLDAYWMGRYYGFISEPKTSDKSLTTVEERGLQLGAEPYSGPPRPKLWHEQSQTSGAKK